MATTHPMRRDTDSSSFALNDRFVKLVPEKDSAALEAQTGLPLDDPEGPGQPKEKDGTQYGRVTICAPLTPHPRLLLPPRARDLPAHTALGAGRGWGARLTFIAHLLCAT